MQPKPLLNPDMVPEIDFLASPNWSDYELLDSGDGQKLERFGAYTFVRPEVQALWTKALPAEKWHTVHGVFDPDGEESGGHWTFLKKVPERWEMGYPLAPGNLSTNPLHRKGNSLIESGISNLKFSVMATSGRHLGVFPECASNWDWMSTLIQRRILGLHGGNTKESVNKSHPKGLLASQDSDVNVLNLFGYTGLASLACAASGAKVTHVDASKKSVNWARTNQKLSRLELKPIRWIVDDALKFIKREVRRGIKYDGILLDPPKFGRGPKGEVWDIYKSLPELLHLCRAVLSDSPIFIVLTVYAVRLPAIHAYATLAENVKDYEGKLECGELVTIEKSAGRLLSQAVYARWKS
jgi:23S rRNA (cytosine1962-C5)-methyltransferase